MVSAERSLLGERMAHAMLEKLTLVVKMLDGLIAFRRQTVREDRADYDGDKSNREDDPLAS